MSVELVQIIDAISHEKGIDRNILIEAIEAAILAAARKRYHPELELSVTFNETTGGTELFLLKDVVRSVKDPELEISLKEAKKIDSKAKTGQKVKILGQMETLGRIAALNAKQLILQRVREAEYETLYNGYKDKIHKVVSGVVLRRERMDLIVDLGKIEGILPRREQVHSEKFRGNERIKAYVLDVKKGAKGVFALLSRTDPGFVRRLFELEVPEIYEGIIEIKGVAREASGRTKIAVCSREKDVDPVGACVGMRGVRVQSIVNELRGEKIDIVNWSEDPTVYVANALSPAKISRVNLHPEENSLEVIAPDDQLSLAIGKRGQNVRLASSLLKWRIDIKGEKELRQEIEEREIKARQDREDLVASLRETEGIGDEETKMLLNEGINSFQKVVNKGVEGLMELGLDAEKAKAVFDMSETRFKEELEREKEFAESKRLSEEEAREEIPAPGAGDLAGPDTEETIKIIENLEEFPIDGLPGIPDSTVERLKSVGYQTIAELSAAEVSELMEEGLEEQEATELLRKAVEFIELHEKV